MSRTHKTRLTALEQAHAANLPLLPALVVWPDKDPEAERAAFTAKHGRAPDVVLIITVDDTSIPDPDASRSD